jgi:hypothetical protein
MNPGQLSAPDWEKEYAKQRYERLCDILAEYMEAKEGTALFDKDFVTAIKELSKPLRQQLAVLEDIKNSYGH